MSQNPQESGRKTPQLVLNQQTITGIAEKFPATAKNNAAYVACTLSWTEMRIAYPTRVMTSGIMMKMYLILNQSERAAMVMLIPNEKAQGGTEYSWV